MENKKMKSLKKIQKFELEIILENQLYACMIVNGKKEIDPKEFFWEKVKAKRINENTIKFKIKKQKFTLIESPRHKINFI